MVPYIARYDALSSRYVLPTHTRKTAWLYAAALPATIL